MIKQMKDDDVEREALERISPELIAQLNKLASYLTEQGEYEAVDLIDTVVARATAMPERELLREALEALTPFASDADLWSGSDSFTLVEAAPGYSDALTVGDLRRARATADKIRAGLKEKLYYD